jgi:hypothetical protein
LALVNRSYGWKQFAPQHVLVKVGPRAEAKCPPDTIVIAQGRDYDDSSIVEFLDERFEHFFSWNDWQIPVQKQHIGLNCLELLQRLTAVACLADDHHIRLGVDYGTYSLPHPGVVVDYQDSQFPIR